MKIDGSEIIKSLEASFLRASPEKRFCYKVGHRTEQFAEYQIASLERSGYLALGPDEKLLTYCCVQCGYWHIGRSHSHGVFIRRIDRRFRQLGLDE